MRIALVLHDASPEPDGAPLFPAVALERDGALYRVSALARAFGPRYADLEDDTDFHHTVVALRGAPLRELDERLRSGERPTATRILPGTFTWLPPCDPQRAAFITCAPPPPRALATQPAFHIGSARTLLGHDATVPVSSFPCSLDGRPHDPALAVEASLALILADDLDHATAAEAASAILGYTLLLSWRPGLAAQLGSVLITADEAGYPATQRALFRIAGTMLPVPDPAPPCTPAEALAWISHHIPLAAGDVIGVSRLTSACATDPAAVLTHGARVELAIERLGRLCGRAVQGPEPRPWRRDVTHT